MKLFSRERKEKRKQGLPEAPQNAYYEEISARLGILQVVLYLSVLTFAVLSFATNTSLITYRNFYYFFRDLSASAEKVDIFDADSVSYPMEEEQSFSLYRRGLAVAGNRTVTLFSAAGRPLLSKNISYRSPVAVGHGKYLLVYEMGGTQYSLYNSSAQLHTEETGSAIYGAAVSDSGMYALFFRGKDQSEILLYNNRFSLINRFRLNGYVMDASIASDGSRIAVLQSDVSGGIYRTRLLLATPGAEDAPKEVYTETSMGISCAFTSAGNVVALCTEKLVVCDTDGKIKNEYDFSGATPADADLGADGAALLLKRNNVSGEKTRIVFDKDGNVVYNEETTEPVSQLCLSDGMLFWFSDGAVCRRNLKTGETDSLACTTDRRTLIAIDENEVLCCSGQKAVYLTFD